MAFRSLKTLYLAGLLLTTAVIPASAEGGAVIESANGIPTNGSWESNYDYDNYQSDYNPDYGFDPFGFKGLLDFKAWGDTTVAAAQGPQSLLGIFGSVITMDLRQALIDMVFEPLSTKLFHTSTRIIDSQGFENLYKFFTRMAMSFLVLLFAWTAIKSMVGADTTPFMVMILKTLAGLAYLSLIPYLLKGIIWINNSLCAMVISFVGGEGVFGPIFSPSFGAIHLILFMLIYLVYAIRLLIYYFGRDYLITLLLICAPFMWFMWIDDGLKKNTATWLRHLITLIFTQLIHAIQLAIFSVIILALGGSSQTFWGNIESVIFAIVSMAYMVQAPNFVKNFTYEASSGNMGGAMRQLVSYIAFAKERKAFGAILGGFKKK